MGFSKQSNRIPTSIGQLQVILTSQADGTKSAQYGLFVLDQDGNRMPFVGDNGDLVPYLNPTQINALISFMNDLRTQATNQIILGL